MDSNDINNILEKVDGQAIKCGQNVAYSVSFWLDNSAKARHKKQTRSLGSEEDIPQKIYKPEDYKGKREHYSGRVGKKAEMIRQFNKAKIFIEKKADEKMVQEEVLPFEPEVDNFLNLVTIENQGKKDLKITLDLPLEIEKILQHSTKWLEDRINSHVQQLIKRKNKDTDGLQDPVLQCFPTVDGKFVRVLYVNKNH